MRIAPESERRCYEPTGMSTAKWKLLDPVPVPIVALVLQQDALDIAALLGTAEPLNDLFPHVVQWRGQAYVSDGHHRIVRAWLRGEKSMLMRVLEMEDEECTDDSARSGAHFTVATAGITGWPKGSPGRSGSKTSSSRSTPTGRVGIARTRSDG